MFLPDKVEAVYELREAVEKKVRAEVAVETNPTRQAKDNLLEATLNVENCTQHALEVCHTCGRTHADEAAACRTDGNVVEVDFRAANNSRPRGT